MVCNVHKRRNKQRFITLEISRAELTLTLSLSHVVCWTVHAGSLHASVRIENMCVCVYIYTYIRASDIRIFTDCVVWKNLHRHKFSIFFFFLFTISTESVLGIRGWRVRGIVGAGIVGNGGEKMRHSGIGRVWGMMQFWMWHSENADRAGNGGGSGSFLAPAIGERSIGKEWESRFWSRFSLGFRFVVVIYIYSILFHGYFFVFLKKK